MNMKYHNTGIVLTIALILSQGCKKSEPSVIGDWQAPTMQTVTFYQDGTMAILDKGQKFPGRYTLQPEHKIVIENGFDKESAPYSFKDENTLLIGNKGGSTDELRRITHK